MLSWNELEKSFTTSKPVLGQATFESAKEEEWLTVCRNVFMTNSYEWNVLGM